MTFEYAIEYDSPSPFSPAIATKDKEERVDKDADGTLEEKLAALQPVRVTSLRGIVGT